ncbi:hypothetical protein Btru_041644 [Bulinus truncatus]|nr:hypothetical protein Btru_041644 [Bulinus truncatus]
MESSDQPTKVNETSSDSKVGCCGFFCFGCYACSIAADIDESCCVPCFVPGWLVSMRTKIRIQNNIEGSILRDCCVSYWCAGCAMCQLAREVKDIQAKK